MKRLSFRNGHKNGNGRKNSPKKNNPKNSPKGDYSPQELAWFDEINSLYDSHEKFRNHIERAFSSLMNSENLNFNLHTKILNNIIAQFEDAKQNKGQYFQDTLNNMKQAVKELNNIQKNVIIGGGRRQPYRKKTRKKTRKKSTARKRKSTRKSRRKKRKSTRKSRRKKSRKKSIKKK